MTLRKPDKPSRWGHLNGFVDVTLRDLTPAEVRVWLVLFRDTKPDGTARTGQTDIARRAGLSVRMVKKLADRGVLKVIRVGRAGGRAEHIQGAGREPELGELGFPLQGELAMPEPGNRSSPIPEWDQNAEPQVRFSENQTTSRLTGGRGGVRFVGPGTLSPTPAGGRGASVKKVIRPARRDWGRFTWARCSNRRRPGRYRSELTA